MKEDKGENHPDVGEERKKGKTRKKGETSKKNQLERKDGEEKKVGGWVQRRTQFIEGVDQGQDEADAIVRSSRQDQVQALPGGLVVLPR